MPVDFFLKIDTIEGESQVQGHVGEIQLESWSWGETNTGTHAAGGGGGAGKVSMQDFHFTMKVCKASPKLFLACATGQHIPKATLTARKAGGKQEIYQVTTFSDLLISSFQAGGASASDVLPSDQISFNFAKVEMEYKEQKADGSMAAAVKAGYDLKKMQKV